MQVGPPGPGGAPPPDPAPSAGRGRGRGLDRVLGIALGIILGVGIVTAFVFLGSEGTIDAPRISGAAGAGRQKPEAGSPDRRRALSGKQRAQGSVAAAGIPVVEVIGGAPPESGPPQFDFTLGGKARFKISTDAPVAISIPGYGIDDTVDSAAIVSFRATKPGQFPVVASATDIAIATLRIRR